MLKLAKAWERWSYNALSQLKGTSKFKFKLPVKQAFGYMESEGALRYFLKQVICPP